MNLLLSLIDRSPKLSCLLSATGWSSGWLPIVLGFGLLLSPLAVNADPVGAQEVSAGAAAQKQNTPILRVNPVAGDDAAGNGSEQTPYKTITRALQVAPTKAVIQLMPGTYSVETGEQFPLQLRAGIVLQGNPQTRGSDVVIQGGGLLSSPTSARQNVAIVAAKQSALIGVTVSNPQRQGYGLWIESSNPTVSDNTFTGNGHDGISVVGNSNPVIRNNFFYQNAANGITIYGTSRPELRENIFEQTGFAININQNAAPFIIGNRITQNKDGIVVQAKARPVLRNNSIENNERDGLVAIAQSRPDLGVAGEPGGNFIRNNGQFDVNAQALKEQMPAFGNEISKTTGNLDLTGAELTAPVAVSPLSPTAAPPSANPTTTGAIAVQPPSAPVAEQPRPAPATSSVTVVPFGERLTPIPVTAPVATPEPAPGARVSADSFPAPGGQPRELVVTRPTVPAPVIVASNREPIAVDPFPVPSQLSGQPEVQPRRPLQIVRVATPELTPVATATPAPPTAAFPLPRPVTTPAIPLAKAAPPNTPPARIYIPPKPAEPVARSVAFIPTPPNQTSTTTANRPLQLLAPLPQTASSTHPLAPAQPVASATTGFPVPSVLGRNATISPVPTASADRPVKTTPDAAIPIPVPLPERRSTPVIEAQIPTQSAFQPPASSRQVAAAPAQPAKVGLLPVPGPNAPIGNAGSRSSVKVFGSRSPDGSSPPVPPDRSSLLGVRYRVVVETEDATQVTQLKTLMPEAFSTSFNGRTAMQVGAFGDRQKADQLVQSLTSQGLRAVVETIE